MNRLKIEDYQSFMSQQDEILRLLKHHIVNELKGSENVEFVNISSNTEQIKVEAYTDEVYRTATGRMSTDDFLYKVIKSFKRQLKSFDESETIKIKDISITIEDIADFAGDKYNIVFEISNQ